jgi:hypothetical protein
MKLYASPASSLARKIRVMRVEKGIGHDLEMVNLWQANELQKTNPIGKVPALKLDDGRVLTRAPPLIADYVDSKYPSPRFIPADPEGRFEVRRWEAIADGTMEGGRHEPLRSAPSRRGQAQPGLARAPAPQDRRRTDGARRHAGQSPVPRAARGATSGASGCAPPRAACGAPGTCSRSRAGARAASRRARLRARLRARCGRSAPLSSRTRRSR